MLKHHRFCVYFLAITLFALFILGFSIFCSSHLLSVHSFSFSQNPSNQEGKAAGVRMVILSDLHSHEFGRGNIRLIEKVQAQSPDLILLVGDMINETAEDARGVCDLVSALRECAPVYYALGNHEYKYMKETDEGFADELAAAGAAVLEEEYVDLNINENKLRLGGMYGYAFGTDNAGGENSAAAVPDHRGAFLREFEDTDRFKVMMAHRPDSFIFGDASSHWDIDLVVSGHNHGGQIVVPFLGGLYGGDQGWFPKYIHGMYRKDKMELFITSGLAGERKNVPRINNLPEIAVVTLF